MPPLHVQRSTLENECVKLLLQIYDTYNEQGKRNTAEVLAIHMAEAYSLPKLKQWKAVMENSIAGNAMQKQNERNA